MNRREFLGAGLMVPSILRRTGSRPVVTSGVQSGDPRPDGALLWARSDRPSRMIVEYATTEGFTDARRVVGPNVSGATDYTGRVELERLEGSQDVFYRVLFEDVSGRETSAPVRGRFRTAPASRRTVRFVWSGDTAGQGYGINPDTGGMTTYESMRRLDPDFFIHCGDTIYADGPIPSEIVRPGGLVWRNVTTEAKSKVAETLDEFRGNYLYNLLDVNVTRFNGEVCQVWQWDDHEVTNNWSPGLDLSSDDRYRVKDIGLLSGRARRAFLEYAPISLRAGGRIHRKIAYGPSLDVFVIDLRTYRGPNSHNRQEAPSGETTWLGSEQLGWLEEGLRTSRATWKVVASDMPVGLLVTDGTDAQGRTRFENGANGDGPPLGRELEIGSLLSSVRGVRNVVWLTADVHYAAAHVYEPANAVFTDFDPFWEFVAGPLAAGSFGPGSLDDTFGPRVVFQRFPPGPDPDRSPAAGYQSFGEVVIDGSTELMTVRLRDGSGRVLYSTTLDPVGR